MTRQLSRRAVAHRLSSATQLIEGLEPRRLFSTFAVNGTSGGDVISIDYHFSSGLLFYDFNVNGATQQAGPAAAIGNVVNVNGMGGNDVIVVNRLHSNDDVNINPGPGNDEMVVGQGNLGSDIAGEVRIQQQPNEGNDELFVDDSVGGANHDVHVSNSAISAGPADIYQGGGLASIYLAMPGTGTTLHEVYVDETPANMTIDMGDGTAPGFVHFGGDNHVLESSAIPMTIIGANIVYFDDTEGAGGRTFDITPTGSFGKTMVDVTSIRYMPRGDNGNNPYTFNITGSPSRFTAIESCAARVNFGSFNTPVDLASFTSNFDLRPRGTYEINDIALTSPSSPFVLQTLGSAATHQNIRKGNFNLTITDGDIDMQIVEYGNSNTVFQVAKQAVDSSVRLFGGNGNDTLQTVNSAVTSEQFDLDDVFVGQSFFFNGGGGDNLLDLNDSNGNTQFGNPQYILDPGVVGVELGELIKNGEVLLNFFGPNADRVNWAGSSDNDQFFFAGFPGNSVTLSGGSGDDLFSTYQPDHGGGNLALEGIDAVIDGGTGFNALTVDDTAGGTATSFSMNTAVFHGEMDSVTYNVAGATRTISYDDISSIQIFQGSGAATTSLTSKPTNLQLTVDTGGGNDIVHAGGGDIDSNGWRNTTISGGAGTDFIRFNDSLDAPNFFGSNAETETYALGNQSLSKGPAGFSCNGFESQQLDTGNGESDVVTENNILNLNVIPANMPTTITGGNLRTTTVNIAPAARDLDAAILSPLSVLLGSAAGSVMNVMDQNETGTKNYDLSTTQLLRTGVPAINFSGLTSLVINGSQGGNKKFTVNATPAGQTTTLNATASAAAFNQFWLGGGNVSANLLGPVTVNASGGASNGVVIDNSLDSAPSAQTINGAFFTDGQTHTTNNASSVVILNNGGGGTINVNRVTTYCEARNNGSAAINIGAGNLDANILAAFGVDGAGVVTVDDRLDTGNDGYVVDLSSFRKTNSGAPTISVVNYGAAILHCNNADNVITVNNTGTGVQVFGNGGNDQFDVLNTKPNFFAPTPNTLGIDTGGENVSASPFGDTVNVSGNSWVQLINHDTIRSLNVTGSNAKFTVPTGVACKAQAMSLTGVIDLAGGALLSPAGGPSQTTFRNQVIAGRNNGAWNGTGASGAINSSLAGSTSKSDGVGYGLGSQISPTTIGPFAIAAGDTLLRYTLDGDANLDQRVDTIDFSVLAANFGGLAKVWAQADFNYDGAASSVDFNMLASNFSQSVPAAGAAASAPPASLFGDETIDISLAGPLLD